VEVSVKRFDQRLAHQFDRRLAAREEELCALLAARDAVPEPAPAHEPGDFKDDAARDVLARLDALQAERAAHELEEVLYARARLHDRSFGRCIDCDDPIPLERLLAMPATTCCAECQAQRERARHGAWAGTQRSRTRASSWPGMV
jgi:DnaK suppressor protein